MKKVSVLNTAWDLGRDVTYEILIEQLGGYEKAKVFLNATSFTIDELIMMQRSGLRTQHVEKALLEYRRQHSIFEHGDYIVWLFGYEPSHLYKVKYITDKGYSYGNDWGWYGVLSNEGVGHDFRHATELEIKAGHRL